MKTIIFLSLFLLISCASNQPKEICDKTFSRDLRSCVSKCEWDECKDTCLENIKKQHCMTPIRYK